MIDTLSDELVPLAQIARRLPKPPSPATLWRWHVRGVKGQKLEVVRVGGRVYTTESAFADFVARTTAAAIQEPETQTDVRERSSQTKQQLRDAGLLDEEELRDSV